MKAFKEIGFRRVLRFGTYTIAMGVMQWLLFPQLRTPFLQLLGAQIGKDTIIHDIRFFNHYRSGFSAFQTGNECFIGHDCLLDLADQIILEDQVTLAERVTVLTHTNVGYSDHPLQNYFPSFTRPVIFRQGSFVGASATVLPGVEIGTQAFVAAGAVVTKDVPPHTVAAGVPAQVTRTLESKVNEADPR